MRTGIRSFTAPSSARRLRLGRVPVLVGIAAATTVLLGLAAACGIVEPIAAIDGGSALAAVGGVGAFLAGE